MQFSSQEKEICMLFSVKAAKLPSLYQGFIWTGWI